MRRRGLPRRRTRWFSTGGSSVRIVRITEIIAGGGRGEKSMGGGYFDFEARERRGQLSGKLRRRKLVSHSASGGFGATAMNIAAWITSGSKRTSAAVGLLCAVGTGICQMALRMRVRDVGMQKEGCTNNLRLFCLLGTDPRGRPLSGNWKVSRCGRLVNSRGHPPFWKATRILGRLSG